MHQEVWDDVERLDAFLEREEPLYADGELITERNGSFKFSPSPEDLRELDAMPFELQQDHAQDILLDMYSETKQCCLDYLEFYGGCEVLLSTEPTPMNIFSAIMNDDMKPVMDWLGSIPHPYGKVNSILQDAIIKRNWPLCHFLLLNGADIRQKVSWRGKSVGMLSRLLLYSSLDNEKTLSTVRVCLEWGGEKEVEAIERAEACGFEDLHNLLVSPLGGRRCEIVGLKKARSRWNGKIVTMGEYFLEKDHYRATIEGTNETLLIHTKNLKRRDRTPEDPGFTSL